MFSRLSSYVTLDRIAQLENQLGLLLANCTDLVIDSRRVIPGCVFCAYPGTLNDGRNYIAAAVAAKARAIIWESGRDLDIAIENYPLDHLMHLVGILASIRYQYPTRGLHTIGVTGTNGKTSISHWLNQAYTQLGKTSAIIGTTGAGIYSQINDYASTTPDPVTIQSLLADFRSKNVDLVAMEVSSHGLDQGRVNGILFSSAIFTNLTQDHLDYHLTMENYFQAKAKLFYWHGLKNAIVNSDDVYGKRLINELQAQDSNLNIISYGIESGSLRAKNIILSNTGSQFTLVYNSNELLINTPIVGKFNIYNLLAVIASLIVDGIPFDIISEIISNLQPVTGRMDTTMIPGKPLVVVDYSHTPDSLEKALLTLAEIKGDGRLICVFGCGGNRDNSKRPLMGSIASKLADHVIITTDNPRFEDPQEIISQIISGVNCTNYEIVIERKEAIAKAIANAKAEDTILIAGKGHENYQEIAGVKYHFSDLEIVRELLDDYPL